MTEQAERPTALRRRPRAASDEHVDPVDYVQPEPTTAATHGPGLNEGADRMSAPANSTDSQNDRAVTSASPSATPPSTTAPVVHRGPGPRRREPTIQLGVRVAQDVSNLIDELAAEDGTARAVVENAVRAYAAQRDLETGGH